MKKLTQRNKRLLVEQLEDRVTPSLSLAYYGSNLIIRGSPTDLGGGGLNITGQSDGSFQVMDGTSFLGDYHVNGNLFLLLNRHPDNITIDLSALPNSTYGGNMYINLGVGNTDPTPGGVIHPLSIVGGTIGGSLVVTGGRGFEEVDLGATTAISSVVDPVTIAGNVYVSGSADTPPAPYLAAPNMLTLAPGSSIGGNLTTLHEDTVNIGNALIPSTALASVSGNVSIDNTDGGESLFVAMNGYIGGNFTAIGTGNPDNTQAFAAGPYGDAVDIEPNGVTGGGTVEGNVLINLGANSVPANLIGDANVTVDTGALIAGNLTIDSTGGSTDSITIGSVAAQINGSVNLNLSNGANSITLGALPTSTPSAVINGNLNLIAGNGNNLLNFGGSVNGNVGIELGNGTDTAAVGTSVGGLVNWHSGNGNDSLALGSAANDYYVNAIFGNNDDSFTLATTGLVSGDVNGGGRFTSTGNVFTQGNAVLTSYFQLSNFP